MRKITVFLDAEVAAALRLAAAATGTSQSTLMREGVRDDVAPGAKRSFHSLGKGKGNGEPMSGWTSGELHPWVFGRR
ncbi:MAG: ribbon-helix-helix protein, CopG family [Chloroflexota bacterium]